MKDRNRLVLFVSLIVLVAVGLALAGAWQSRDPNADVAGLELSELFAERHRLRGLGGRGRRRVLIEARLQAGDLDNQIEQAVALLASGQAATRRGAMRWLAGREQGAGRDVQRERLVAVFARYADHSDREMRAVAALAWAEACCRRGDDAPLPEAARSAMVHVFGLGEEAISGALIWCLQHPVSAQPLLAQVVAARGSRNIDWLAAAALHMMHVDGEAVRRRLEELFRSADDSVRSEAAAALLRLEDSSIVGSAVEAESRERAKRVERVAQGVARWSLDDALTPEHLRILVRADRLHGEGALAPDVLARVLAQANAGVAVKDIVDLDDWTAGMAELAARPNVPEDLRRSVFGGIRASAADSAPARERSLAMLIVAATEQNAAEMARAAAALQDVVRLSIEDGFWRELPQMPAVERLIDVVQQRGVFAHADPSIVDTGLLRKLLELLEGGGYSYERRLASEQLARLK